MKQICSVLSGIVFLFCGSQTFAGGDRVSLELAIPSAISAGPTTVSFKLLDTKTNQVITTTDLQLSHEKRLHFIAYDPGLKEFQHVHPEFDGKVWSIDMNFPVDGNYFIWAQGKLQDATDFNAVVRLAVSGGQSAWPSPTLSDVRTGTETNSVATLSGGSLKAGKMAMLTLTFTETDGSAASITPYLGAFAHVIATPEDGSSLLHVHPMDGNQPNEGMVHVTFPTEGYYRLWIQFIDGGQLKTIPLSVAVTK